MPTNLAFAPDGSRLYVTELLNHRVSMFDTEGHFLGSFGGEGAAPGQMSHPFGIAVDASGQVFVANQRNHRVDRFDAEGRFLGSWGGFGTVPGRFNHVVGLSFDAAENLYATDQLNNRVQKLRKDGTPLTVWGSFGRRPGQMYNPWAVIPLPNCRVWVADTYNYRTSVIGLRRCFDRAVDPPALTAAGLATIVPPSRFARFQAGSCFSPAGPRSNRADTESVWIPASEDASPALRMAGLRPGGSQPGSQAPDPILAPRPSRSETTSQEPWTKNA